MRNITNCLPALLLAAVLGLVGCGKSATPPPSPATGLMDMGKLQQAFPAASDEIKSSLEKIRMDARYGQFESALAELDKLSQLPNLTDAQKQAINDKVQAVKQAISAAPPSPPK